MIDLCVGGGRAQGLPGDARLREGSQKVGPPTGLAGAVRNGEDGRKKGPAGRRQHAMLQAACSVTVRLWAVCQLSFPTPLARSVQKKNLEYIVNTTYLRTVRYGLYFYKPRPKFIIPCAPGIADSLSFFLSGSRRDKEAIDRLQGQLTTDANPKPHTYKSGVANDITSRTYCRFHLQIPVSVQLTVSGSSYMYRVYYDSTVP